MTRTTEHRNLTNDGRDADYLRQCERAADFARFLSDPSELTADYAADAGCAWDVVR